MNNTSRPLSRKEILADNGTVINIKLLDDSDRVRITIIKETGHYAHADLDLSGIDRASERLDDLAEILEADIAKRDGMNKPPQTPSYDHEDGDPPRRFPARNQSRQ